MEARVIEYSVGRCGLERLQQHLGIDPEPVATETGHSRCEAKGAEFAIGKQASPQLLEQARTRAGAQIARILKPNDMVTLEYRSDRLNLNTDANLVVNRVNCG